MRMDSTIEKIIRCDSFKGFGEYLFPPFRSESDGKLTLAQAAALFPCHEHVSAETMLDVLNFMSARAARGEKLFYDFAAPAQKKRDPSSAKTGLFFFRGIPRAPFAIVCAGGGFSYVGSLHESLPHAMRLAQAGFNAFALHYRLDSLEAACEDLASAISFVFENAFDLGVGTDCYSLWGGSDGAHIAAYLASYGPHAFGGSKLPRPGTLVMQYTCHPNHTRQEPPTFVCVGERDSVCDWKLMKKRTDAIAACGIETEFYSYPTLGHGFGPGIGTEAEGWIDRAIVFWTRQLPARARRILKDARPTAAGTR